MISVMSVDISMTAVISPFPLKMGEASTSTATSRPSRDVTRSSLRWTWPSRKARSTGQTSHFSLRRL